MAVPTDAIVMSANLNQIGTKEARFKPARRISGHARQLCAFWLILFVTGCAPIYRDVSNNPPYPTDYVAGAVYSLKHDRFVERPAGALSFAPLIVTAVSNAYIYPDAPRSAAEYQRDPGRWSKIVGVMPSGTRLRVTQVRKESFLFLDTVFSVFAEVLDGPFAGKTVEISWISKGNTENRMLTVDPNELERIEIRP